MAKARKMRQAEIEPGYEGAVLVKARVQLSAIRFEERPIRCRPGTFEYEYGARKKNSALYDAGMHFSNLWERAHITIATPDLRRAGVTQWRGLPDSRADALSEIRAVPIGSDQTSRLIDYCIMGNTTTEIGAKWGFDRKAMSHVLHMDLLSVARHFQFV
jgi:hypothetical protein